MRHLILSLLLVGCGDAVSYESVRHQDFETTCACWLVQGQLDICTRPLYLECADHVGYSQDCMPQHTPCYPSVDPYIMCCWPDVVPHP